MKDKIFVTYASIPPIEEYIEEIKTIWENHMLTNMGTKHNQLEERLKEYLGVQELSLMVNGHMALELAIQALNMKSEVITTPFTFASTTHAIVRNGLTPVFCDIEPDRYTIDVSKIEALITDRTTAIIPVHVYGNICEIEEIERIAKKYELKVLYDAAHTFGITYKGKGIGTYGDASVFSFHATKVFNTIEGGAVCFRNKEFGESLYMLKNFGIRNEVEVDGVGANAKMNEFQAAMGLCNLRHINANIEKRKEIVYRYFENLDGADGIKLNTVQNGVTSNYAYFPIVIDETLFGASRNEVYEALKEKNIYSRKYFYPLTSEFGCFKGKYDATVTPVALHISKRVLTLPLFPELELEEVDEICRIILRLKKKKVF